MTDGSYIAEYLNRVAANSSGLPNPGDGRMYVLDAGGCIRNISKRDHEQAKDCRFFSCRLRETPCLDHPRTEWGA